MLLPPSVDSSAHTHTLSLTLMHTHTHTRAHIHMHMRMQVSSPVTLPPPPSPRITAHAEQATAAQLGLAPPPSPCRHTACLPPSPLMRHLGLRRAAAVRPTQAHTSPSNLVPLRHQHQQHLEHEWLSAAGASHAHSPSAPLLGMLPAFDDGGGWMGGWVRISRV